jgi:hypothetical protein
MRSSRPSGLAHIDHNTVKILPMSEHGAMSPRQHRTIRTRRRRDVLKAAFSKAGESISKAGEGR